MRTEEILKLYQKHPVLANFAGQVGTQAYQKFQCKGLVGSQAAFFIAAMYRSLHKPVLVLVNDKEDALYFHSDMKLLMPQKEILLFPASYRRPYQIEDVDNANVLQRAEVLNELNHTRSERQLVVSFAEALYEKVVNRRSLVKNTLEVRTGDTYGMSFITDVLDEYGFERSDFVYEPGQYALRGGIVDIYSFAHELPYRIEFLGDEIESIRTFDPVSQISEGEVKRISLIPNIQTQLLQEEKVSFLEYISPDTIIFTRSIDFILADLDRMYEKAQHYYDNLQSKTGGAASSKTPELMYLSGAKCLEELKTFTVVEFGAGFFESPTAVLEWKGQAQPAFNKEFNLLASHLIENEKEKYYKNFVFSDNEAQFTRLKEIFEGLKQPVNFQGVMGEIHEGFSDPQLAATFYTDHQIFDRYHKYKTKTTSTRTQALTLKELRELKSGDYVTHVNHGIGQYAGLHKIKIGEHEQEAIKIIFSGNDEVFVNVNALYKVAKYVGKDSEPPKLSKIGSNNWEKAKAKTKARVKQLAFDLVNLYAMRKAQKGFSFSPDNYIQQELEASFMYEDTPDQYKATQEVKRDMEKAMPMDRLVCGDVGFGKTEVAVRAAVKAALDGKQTAILVPTTILALQHFKTFAKRLASFPISVDYVNRFKTTQQIKHTLERVKEGKVDILIGTHRVVSKDVVFKDLGLLIIDEEQRFGVNVKDKLKVLRTSIDTLTLTATPIPRTLQFSLMGIRDLSVISTPPPNRQPIETIIMGMEATQLRDAVAYELKRGGQVFFIHPRVKDIDEVAAAILKLVPDARIRIAHGQMDGDKLEEVMTDFIEGHFDVLVSTTIVESGLDIPNANTIIINEANKYGLSELHQMRGRVGRSNRKAFCYLIAPPEFMQTTDARKRLKAMEEFSDLGSGFHIALRDLDIRGAGDLLGGEQSGFIGEIGYEMYNRILNEAVQELQEMHFADVFEEEIKKRKQVIVEDCQIDLDLDIRIPDTYLPSTAERLNFYRRIANASTEEEYRTIMRELIDRFGALPQPVLNLFDTTRIREAAKRAGLERIILKGKSLRLYFVSNAESRFYTGDMFSRLIQYVQVFSGRCAIKDSKKGAGQYLAYEQIDGIKSVLETIDHLRSFLVGEAEKMEEAK